MKVDYAKEVFGQEHRFTFILKDHEVYDPLSNHGYPSHSIPAYMYGPLDYQNDMRVGFALALIKEAYLKKTNETDVDLGFNYKEKYKEIEALLEPYKIDNMEPVTTLKMLLKYEL
jgi:hypothetical protein